MVHGRLHAETLGTRGPLAVFLPGLGGSTRYWRERVEPLAPARRILLVDPLGFGASPKPRLKYTMARHVQELRRVLMGHDGRVTLVGHSFGAMLALAYAARFPEDVARVVLVSMPVFDGADDARRFFRAVDSPNRFLTGNVAFAAAACILGRRVFGRLAPRLLQDFPREVAEDFVKHTWRSFTGTLWDAVYAHDVEADAVLLPDDVEVLCLHGERDASAPPARINALLKANPRWYVVWHREADHHLPLTHAPWLARELDRFLPAGTAPAAATRAPSSP